MDVMGAEVEEKRFLLVPLKKGDRLLRQGVGNFVVLPEGGLAAGLLADAGKAHDKRARRSPLHQVIQGNRVRGIEIDHATVLHPDAGGAIARGGEQPGIVEPDLQRAGLDLAIVIGGRLRSQPQVPLADHAGGVNRLDPPPSRSDQ